MSILLQLIKTFTPNIKSQKDFDDAYLSDSTDVHDLERRMREIERRGRSDFHALACRTSLR